MWICGSSKDTNDNEKNGNMLLEEILMLLDGKIPQLHQKHKDLIIGACLIGNHEI